MRKIHLVLQNKGGCGKTTLSAYLAQYLTRGERQAYCVDTDPDNASFAAFDALNVAHIQLVEGDAIQPLKFDSMLCAFVEAAEDAVFVVDTGASTFIPLCSYLREIDGIDLLHENACEVLFHVPVSGGAAINDTMNGLDGILRNFPEVQVVVWLNEHSGAIDFDGYSFEKTKLFIQYAARFHAIGQLRRYNEKTVVPDVQRMLEKKKTFEEALNDPSFTIFQRQRLKGVMRDVFATFDTLNL